MNQNPLLRLSVPVTMIVGLLGCLPLAANPDYTLHEWGTFTTVMGSDGTHLDGVEREDAPLPDFVYEMDRPETQPLTKGLEISRTFSHVNVRMETPVIYFYTDHAFDARIDVKFNGGTIGQWFPQRSGGEAKPQEAHLDYADTRTGHIHWKVKVAPAGDDQFQRIFQGGELPCWLFPRQTDSALVTAESGETDKYLFYRGLGRFNLPVKFSATDSTIQAAANGAEPLAQWLVFDLNERNEARWWLPGKLESGGAATKIAMAGKSHQANWKQPLYADGLKFLMDAGLFRKEADAMLQTWWNDYFGKPGLRVFWIAPTKFVDQILPLTASPAPKSVTRVMVGRAEILTPAFEKRLLEDFQRDEQGHPNPWTANRFFPAYSNRVKALLKEAAEPSSIIAPVPAELSSAPKEMGMVLPQGIWQIGFTNGVSETVSFEPDGKATVSDMFRRSTGIVSAQSTHVEIRSGDGRVEHWVPKLGAYWVQHWAEPGHVGSGPVVEGTAIRATPEAAPDRVQPGLKVHEWGTFTVLLGSNGEPVRWYQAPKSIAELPAFVKAPALNAVGKSGAFQQLYTMRMETPVVYFYPSQEMEVLVRAGFPDGRITEVFPPAIVTGNGETVWAGKLLPPNSPERRLIPEPLGSTGRHYAAARGVPEAWLFKNHAQPQPQPVEQIRMTKGLRSRDQIVDPKQAPEASAIDHFIFYRGAGSVYYRGVTAVPGKEAGTYILSNTWQDTIPFILALNVMDGQTSWKIIKQLQPLEYAEGQPLNQQTLTFPVPAGPAASVAEQLRNALIPALQSEGLTEAEARAMVATWDNLWFTEPGLRLLAVLPQSYPDALVPLQITPKPAQLHRVFVARVEILQQEQENALVKLLTPSSETPATLRPRLDSLHLGRFESGGLERAVFLMEQQMRGRFSLIREEKDK